MKSRFDVIVVGAGTAGCLAAMTAAERGLEVCLIESKPMEEIGVKVCGDAVGRHHFDNLGLPYPKGEELNCDIRGVDVFSPDMETRYRIEGEGVSGFIIDRHTFGQRLLNLCLDVGVVFHPETVCLGPIVKAGYVRGLFVQNKVENLKRELYAGVTVDASGVPAVLRRNLPAGFGIERSIESSDLLACYREIREGCEFDSSYCEIYLNQSLAPGGYYWIFPKGKGKVNTGMGVQMGDKWVKPRQMFEKVLSSKVFKGSKRLEGGGGFVPTRRPLDCLVANGVVFTGDSAFLVSPIHGGGIGSSMTSGRLAAETIVAATERGDFSQEALWGYPEEYNRQYGAKQAGLDIFRIFLQSIKDEELNYGMRHRLVKVEDVLKVSLKGDLRLSISEKAERAFKGLRNLRFLTRLRETVHKMREIKKLYLDYTKPEGLEDWKKRVEEIY